MEIDTRVISPRAFVFVEERRFHEPVRRSTVVVHNTTIINQTVNITNTKIVNNTVINGGPATSVMERASGTRLQPVPARELRHKEETAAVARPRTPAAPGEKKVSAPVHSETGGNGKSTPIAPAPPQVQKPGPITRVPSAPVAPVTPPAPKKPEAPSERPKPAPIAPPHPAARRLRLGNTP